MISPHIRAIDLKEDLVIGIAIRLLKRPTIINSYNTRIHFRLVYTLKGIEEGIEIGRVIYN